MSTCTKCAYDRPGRDPCCVHPVGPDLTEVGPLWKKRIECMAWTARSHYRAADEAEGVAAAAWERSETR